MKETTKKFRVLSLDGGGSKGVYTLGVLKEVEAQAGGKPLCEVFDLIYGTSAGTFIAALLALGKTVSEIEELYFDMIPKVMVRTSRARTVALRKRVYEIFGDLDFSSFKTHVGLVCTNYDLERPMVFKNSSLQLHSQQSEFKPGFGVSVADAVLASTAAYPLFAMHTVRTELHGEHLLMDGSYVGNNPTLFALADARNAFKKEPHEISVLSIGVGEYQVPRKSFFQETYFSLWPMRHISKMFNIGSRTIEQLQVVLFPDIACIRINDSYPHKEYATDLLERDIEKLRKLFVLGRESFAQHKNDIELLVS